jgi:hypothetical protein
MGMAEDKEWRIVIQKTCDEGMLKKSRKNRKRDFKY